MGEEELEWSHDPNLMTAWIHGGLPKQYESLTLGHHPHRCLLFKQLPQSWMRQQPFSLPVIRLMSSITDCWSMIGWIRCIIGKKMCQRSGRQDVMRWFTSKSLSMMTSRLWHRRRSPPREGYLVLINANRIEIMWFCKSATQFWRAVLRALVRLLLFDETDLVKSSWEFWARSNFAPTRCVYSYIQVQRFF